MRFPGDRPGARLRLDWPDYPGVGAGASVLEVRGEREALGCGARGDRCRSRNASVHMSSTERHARAPAGCADARVRSWTAPGLAAEPDRLHRELRGDAVGDDGCAVRPGRGQDDHAACPGPSSRRGRSSESSSRILRAASRSARERAAVPCSRSTPSSASSCTSTQPKGRSQRTAASASCSSRAAIASGDGIGCLAIGLDAADEVGDEVGGKLELVVRRESAGGVDGRCSGHVEFPSVAADGVRVQGSTLRLQLSSADSSAESCRNLHPSCGVPRARELSQRTSRLGAWPC